MADDDMKAELERLRKENAALKKGTSSSVRMKVSEKGALSVYGMGRFPVALYKEQSSGVSCCQRCPIEGERVSPAAMQPDCRRGV
jgi:hypothetical protein